MKIFVINQPEIPVTDKEAQDVIRMIDSGVDYIKIKGEYVPVSSISGIRNDLGKTITSSMWGALPAGKMKSFFDERREPKGDGYNKFQEMKRKLLQK